MTLPLILFFWPLPLPPACSMTSCPCVCSILSTPENYFSHHLIIILKCLWFSIFCSLRFFTQFASSNKNLSGQRFVCLRISHFHIMSFNEVLPLFPHFYFLPYPQFHVLWKNKSSLNSVKDASICIGDIHGQPLGGHTLENQQDSHCPSSHHCQ